MSKTTYQFTASSGPFAPQQSNGGASTKSMTIVGSGAMFDGTFLNLSSGTYLDAGAAGIRAQTTQESATNQAPSTMEVEFAGIIPGVDTILVDLYDWSLGRFTLAAHWQTGKVRLFVQRDGQTATIESDGGLSNSIEERIAARYEDDATGPGGTITFLRDGQPFGSAQTIGFKPRITPGAELQCNASLGNTNNSSAIKIREISIAVDETVGTPPPPPPPPPSGSDKVSAYAFSNASGPFVPTTIGGGVTDKAFALAGSGASHDGTYLNLTPSSFLDAAAANIALPTDPDPAITQTPESLTLEWTGILPADEAPLVELYDWNTGRMGLYSHWQTGALRANFKRDSESALLDSAGGLPTGVEVTVGLRFDNDPSGPGGTVTFLQDSSPLGTPQSLAFKPRISPQAVLQSNASLSNLNNSSNAAVRSIRLILSDSAGGGDNGGGDNGGGDNGGGATGDLTLYAPPGSIFPLGLVADDAARIYDVAMPTSLDIVEAQTTQQPIVSETRFELGAGGGSFAGSDTNGGAVSGNLAVIGSGASADGTALNLSKTTYLDAGPIGFALPTDSDPSKTQTPLSMTLTFEGEMPTDEPPLIDIYDYGSGRFTLSGDYRAGRVNATVSRDGQQEKVVSDAGFSESGIQEISARYDDNPNSPGGTVTFLQNGVQIGAAKSVSIKPRITPAAELQHNASLGNTASSATQRVASIAVAIETLSEVTQYVPAPSGQYSGARLEALAVDASAIGTPQAGQVLTYSAGGVGTDVAIIVGDVVVPQGAAYRAVLEDWSSGSAIDTGNPLVMTRPARQNCQFEDGYLAGLTGPWMECLPEDDVPLIDGIRYYCEAIRAGDYIQFQFGYDWDASVMPDNPFGDPTGLESYMVPHKWRIEDEAGNLIDLIERADGGPLNGTDTPRIYAGPYDGNGAAQTTPSTRWYHHGTVRAGIIWRSADPVAHSQAEIDAVLPRFEPSVPYASHTHFSTNGCDGRLFGSGNFNGFGNFRVMPITPSDHQTLVATAGQTQDPYPTGLYSSSSLAAVAATWLAYTPFNQCGRSPITGPGGVRDDRAAVAEPVAQYMGDITASRPHDGAPLSQIALDYLTSYASEPFHAFEDGRCVPVFKGSKANRDIGLRQHYYGYGEGSRPANRSWYVQGGRPYEIATSYSPWRAVVPQGGHASDKPTFGTNQIDLPHAHQFPHWGSMLFATPEFAMLGHKLSDQARLYEPWIIGQAAHLIAERGAAWQFLHCVMQWKTASRNSDRLYSRGEILDFVVADFELFNSRFKAADPGFDNPPSDLSPGGNYDPTLGVYAATDRFGITGLASSGIAQHDFYIGYWLVALGISERLGFSEALRARSATAGTVLDWLIAKHRQRVVGRINQAATTNMGSGSDYVMMIWSEQDIDNAGGLVSALPGTWNALKNRNGTSSSWDVFQSGGSTYQKDGQAMDQLIAAPSVLKNQIGLAGQDLDDADTTARGWRQQKIQEQDAVAPSQAGSSWFRYLQTVHNPAIA